MLGTTLYAMLKKCINTTLETDSLVEQKLLFEIIFEFYNTP